MLITGKYNLDYAVNTTKLFEQSKNQLKETLLVDFPAHCVMIADLVFEIKGVLQFKLFYYTKMLTLFHYLGKKIQDDLMTMQNEDYFNDQYLVDGKFIFLLNDQALEETLKEFPNYATLKNLVYGVKGILRKEENFL